MTFGKCLFPGLVACLLAPVAVAQTAAEPPRFNGSSAAASSANAVLPSDAAPEGEAERNRLARALIEAAILEAAREEGRYFVDERRADDSQP